MPKPTREDALKIARYMGCTGAHQDDNGAWLPCADSATMMRISDRAETKPLRGYKGLKKKRKKRGSNWEYLMEGGVTGIDTLADGSLVSAPVGMKSAARNLRAGDPDVFQNPDSARVRARQLGCIGIRRYQSGSGVAWMPCTNESDYRRSMGSSPQGRRDIAKRQIDEFRRLNRQVNKKKLNERQEDLYDSLEDVVDEHGLFDQSAGPNGAHYMPASKNPFIKEGLVCSNCTYWRGPNGCEIVKGEIEPNAICKLWIIEKDRLGEKSVSVKAGRKARSDRLAATPAPKKDRVFGSATNKPGTASSSSGGVEIGQATEEALKRKVSAHNDRMKAKGKPDWSKASLGQLKAVYRRGSGAFSQSHRPGMTRGQWSMGRVNAFLFMLETGKPRNLRYVGDSDLLPDGHPWAKKIGKSGQKSLRRGSRSSRFDPNAVDGDNDGLVQEGTPFQRPATPRTASQPTLFGSSGRPPSGRSGRQSTPPTQQSSRRYVAPKPTGPKRQPGSTGIGSFFRELGFARLRPMLGEPEDTKTAFYRGKGRYDDERYVNVHRPIIDSVLNSVKRNRPSDQPKTMWVLGGTSGSYKSSMRRDGFQGIPGRDGAVHIDPDEVKEMLPEYEGWVEDGHSDAATLVHQESRDIANSVLKQAIAQDKDIVYDTSGQFNKGGRSLAEAKEKGYRVVAHYTTGDIKSFLAGVKEREDATGRGVPPYIVKVIAQNLPSITRSLVRDGLFDEFYLWDTTQGGKRVPVARKVGSGKLEILDDALWKRYLNGGY